MFTARDLTLTYDKVTPVTDTRIMVYTIGAYTVRRHIHHAADFGDWESFTTTVDRDKGEYLPKIYIAASVDINGNAQPPTVTVQTTSYGALPLTEYEKFFMQIRDGYEIARIFEQTFCGKENNNGNE